LPQLFLRGATDNFLDDVERAINDGVNCFKMITKDSHYLPGAAAVETELATQLSTYGTTFPGLEQYSIKKFAQALESFVKILAENSGRKTNEVLAKITAAHHEGLKCCGFDIDDDVHEGGICKDVTKDKKVFDLYLGKKWGLEYGFKAAVTVLNVDQIIMAKRAGGPKPRDAKGADDNDD